MIFDNIYQFTLEFVTMKTYSLSFLSQDLEFKYQQHITKSHLNVFGKNMLFIGILCVFIGLYALILDEFIVALYVLSYGLVIMPIIYSTAQKYPQNFNMFCLAFQMIIVICIPGLQLLNLIKRPIADIDTFLTGQYITFLLLSYNLGSRFPLKVVVYISNLIIQSFVRIIQSREITPLFIMWILCHCIILNYIYQYDRVQKEAFLTKHNEKLWQKQIGTFSQVGIMTCVSDKGQLQLNLNKCNEIYQKEFFVSNLETLKEFLNKVIITSKDKFNQQVLREMRSQDKCKKFTTLSSKLYKLSGLTNSNHYQFIGLFNELIYDITIFTTWEDQLLNIHTLIKKSQAQTESETASTLKFERKLFTNYRIQSGISIKMLIIKLKQLKQWRQNKGSLKVHQSLISETHNALRMNYNIQLYLNPIYQQCKANFFLLPLIEQINAITLKSIPQIFTLNIKCYIDPTIKLFSCQKTIFQIIFNLFSIIVRPAKKSGNLIVTANLKVHQNISYITFSIATDITTTQELIDTQNYKKTVNGVNKGFHPHNQKVGLEMIVSEYLIGQIGPHSRIKFVNFCAERQMMCFHIYKDLNIIDKIL